MPPKESSTKNKGKRRKKRKAISPLFTDSAQVSDNTVKTGLGSPTGVSNEPGILTETPFKRFHSAESDYFLFDNINMNFSQQSYPGQMLQSPQGQFTPQFTPGTPTQMQSLTTPPPWAISLMDDVKSIKQKVEKIETVEKAVNNITLKLNQLEMKVDNIDKRVVDVEKNCSYVNEKFDDQCSKLKSAENEIKHLNQSCNSLKENMKKLENDRDQLKSKIQDAEFRSMRENLIFYGIPESATTDPPENCENLVKEFIGNNLKLDPTKILLDRVHRLGSSRATGRPRPIIAKFHYFHERENVRSTAMTLRDDLKRNNVGVGVQIPKEWRESRKSLSAVFQDEKRKGNSVKFVGEKLIVNGRQYTPPPTSTS